MVKTTDSTRNQFKAGQLWLIQQKCSEIVRALEGKGDVDGEIAEYRTALRPDPNNVQAHYNLGYALAKKGGDNAEPVA